LPSALATLSELHERLAPFDLAVVDLDARTAALDRYETAHTGRAKPGRYWRIDLDALAFDASSIDPIAGEVRIDNPHARVTACDLRTAAKLHPAALARAFGATGARDTKFGALATAFAHAGAFIHVPADTACDDPIVVTYSVRAGSAFFPTTVVLLERGARATVIERGLGGAAAFVCGVTEIVTEENADLTYAVAQLFPDDARVISTRAALPGRDARVALAAAELGGALAVSDIAIAVERPGADAQVTTVFFPRGSEHVDVSSGVDHRVGNASSFTVVKSAATGSGQARYVGNIRIAANAQGSDASLRDDALLLSPKSHIDSVPALEIAANDVKAYHGATVGALDDSQIFYMESRGIERNAAERMIALGFFEPALARFPTEALRAELRVALEAKLG
jgi:Fe-S cluster assembly protein SufD